MLPRVACTVMGAVTCPFHCNRKMPSSSIFQLLKETWKSSDKGGTRDPKRNQSVQLNRAKEFDCRIQWSYAPVRRETVGLKQMKSCAIPWRHRWHLTLFKDQPSDWRNEKSEAWNVVQMPELTVFQRHSSYEHESKILFWWTKGVNLETSPHQLGPSMQKCPSGNENRCFWIRQRRVSKMKLVSPNRLLGNTL